MGFKCGIVGLPNVGKSTLFNALTNSAQAAAENYPFCTIEPNIGQVAVRDARLDALARIGKQARVVPAVMNFVDIAGLVRGAAKGEGLGNRFLAHIREVDAILHVLRAFEDEDVTHVQARIDPVADAEIVETELMLADLESVERRLEALEKRYLGGDRSLAPLVAVLERVAKLLREGKPARLLEVDAETGKAFAELHLLTTKPVLYVANVGEAEAAGGNPHVVAIAERARAEGAGIIVISAAIEAEIAQLEAEERRAFLADLGLEEAGLDRLIRAGYALLGLITFLTTGAKETRAWTVPKGTRARAAAGLVHTDFARGFIAAETFAVDELLAFGGEQAARDAGKMRLEGGDYVVEDGDVILFRFNV